MAKLEMLLLCLEILLAALELYDHACALVVMLC